MSSTSDGEVHTAQPSQNTVIDSGSKPLDELPSAPPLDAILFNKIFATECAATNQPDVDGSFIQAVQREISCHTYGGGPANLDHEKDRPLNSILASAKEIHGQKKPIKCIHAVFIALMLTQV